jgi:hypothetical protein
MQLFISSLTSLTCLTWACPSFVHQINPFEVTLLQSLSLLQRLTWSIRDDDINPSFTSLSYLTELHLQRSTVGRIDLPPSMRSLRVDWHMMDPFVTSCHLMMHLNYGGMTDTLAKKGVMFRSILEQMPMLERLVFEIVVVDHSFLRVTDPTVYRFDHMSRLSVLKINKCKVDILSFPASLKDVEVDDRSMIDGLSEEQERLYAHEDDEDESIVVGLPSGLKIKYFESEEDRESE